MLKKHTADHAAAYFFLSMRREAGMTLVQYSDFLKLRGFPISKSSLAAIENMERLVKVHELGTFLRAINREPEYYDKFCSTNDEVLSRNMCQFTRWPSVPSEISWK